MLLDPYSFCIEQAYYEHGFDRLTFINDSLEYSIPGSLITLPTLYFAGFGRPAATEIYAKFQAAPISKNPYVKFRMIARNRLQQKGRYIRTKVVQPKTNYTRGPWLHGSIGWSIDKGFEAPHSARWPARRIHAPTCHNGQSNRMGGAVLRPPYPRSRKPRQWS